MKPDLEKTRAYYRNFSSENICDCDYCQNYCARVKAAYPEVARYLDSLGVDSKSKHRPRGGKKSCPFP